MSDSGNNEAGPSSTPLFKKRSRGAGNGGRGIARPSVALSQDHAGSSEAAERHADPASTSKSQSAEQSTSNPTTTRTGIDDNSSESGDESTPVQDLIALRALSRKPTGIELDRLNKGERKKKHKKKNSSSSTLGGGGGGAEGKEDKWAQHMQRGGLVDKDDENDHNNSDDEDASGARRLVRKNNFQGETGTVDVDKHMMAYIEQEMRKRTGWDASRLDNSDPSSIRAAINNPEDDLYRVAEKYMALQRQVQPETSQEEKEGNVALSAAMLSSIPEVDLGIDSRLRNIEQTEKAKRLFYDSNSSSRHTAGSSMSSTATNRNENGDEAFAAARFLRPKHHTMSDTDATKSSTRTRPERRQMATDQLVLDRFKKRQKHFR
ncbi:hypothetical protein BCV70DRAFT_197789 [Testicularia cyperi]|uniref:Uncharacterized protein n=1 Tax=Testicularia cyperi TaxID=1882483 RepID=A0A317XZ71_9BASI|nr:hypothetical protein BCV70DRAFT_197789 [Testicularia cyperi]